MVSDIIKLMDKDFSEIKEEFNDLQTSVDAYAKKVQMEWKIPGMSYLPIC